MEQGYEEFAERINAQIDMNKIENHEDYLEAVTKALKEKPTGKQLKALWKSAGTKINIEQHALIRKAGGKSLEKDKQKNAKSILTDVGEYKKRGSRRTDLKGLDTRRVFAYIKTTTGRRKRMIDSSKTRIVKYPKSYSRMIKGKITVVNIRKRERIFLYDKTGKRLSLKK